ncbi:hypothetical protein LPJ66_003530 [Kickxella alabastrina]|uniref:Uncharacterized protein n=1 Tax=Kickxella alabastrina TaxID=61397 RepID=A0ACC1IN21_9FUNG|nr:hypothetical protein LPJ66_003530 [Kickxella alabastrina]
MEGAAALVYRAAKIPTRRIKAKQANYFLAIRLDDQLVQQRLKQFNDHVQATAPKWRKYLIRPEQVHLTLCAMHLGDENAVNHASKLLSESNDLLSKYLVSADKPTVTIKGVGFLDSGRVVHANVQPMSPEFMGLVRELRLRFWSHGYSECALPPSVPFFKDGLISDGSEKSVTGGRMGPWSPHATLMKMRGDNLLRLKRQATASLKSATKNQGTKAAPSHAKADSDADEETKKVTLNDFFGIPHALHEPFREFELGTQVIARIELLSMLLPKDKNTDYYQKAGQLEI